MKRGFALLTTALLIANPAFAMPGCGSAADRAALKTAALQQELMVAAYRCHDVNEYNQFVLGHRSELISSDDALKAYFQNGDKQRGTATYNKYKTELANAASLESSQDLDTFCGAAAREFDVALQPYSLASIVARVDLMADPAPENCPVLADNRPFPTPAATPPRPPSEPNRETTVGRSEADEDWSADDEDEFDNSDAFSDEPSDLMGPAPHSILDQDVDR